MTGGISLDTRATGAMSGAGADVPARARAARGGRGKEGDTRCGEPDGAPARDAVELRKGLLVRAAADEFGIGQPGKFFRGTIVRCDRKTGLWVVKFEDDGQEVQYDEEELRGRVLVAGETWDPAWTLGEDGLSGPDDSEDEDEAPGDSLPCEVRRANWGATESGPRQATSARAPHRARRGRARARRRPPRRWGARPGGGLRPLGVRQRALLQQRTCLGYKQGPTAPMAVPRAPRGPRGRRR